VALPTFDFAEQQIRIQRLLSDHSTMTEFRSTIRQFTKRVAENYELDDPIIEVGCGYRSSEPEFCLGNRAIRYYTMDPGFEGSVHFCCKVEDAQASLYGQFGAAICTEVLEHVVCPSEFLKYTKRLLKTGGYLVLTVPFWVPIHEHRGNRDYWRFTPRGVASLLAAFIHVALA